MGEEKNEGEKKKKKKAGRTKRNISYDIILSGSSQVLKMEAGGKGESILTSHLQCVVSTLCELSD